MSLSFFLLSKQAYETVFDKIQTIIRDLEELNENIMHNNNNSCLYNINNMNINNHCVNDNLEENIFDNKQLHDLFIHIKENIKEDIKIFEKNIQHLCKHEFVEDEIDIDFERTKKIKYCTICEYTDK